MKLVEINKVTDKTEFNSYVDFDTHPTADLNCLNCNTRISINFRDLKKHQQSEFTNLSEQDAEKISNFIKENLTQIPNSFPHLFLECPGSTMLRFPAFPAERGGIYSSCRDQATPCGA